MRMVVENGKKGLVEDFVLIGGLIVVQFVYAGNSMFLSYLMSLGISPFTLIIFTTFATFLILSPIALCFERSKWPKKLSFKFMTQLFLISCGGVIFQTLFLKGIKLTSPALATAMPNLAPGLIFVIAWAFRLEKVNITCMYSKAKIVGTLLCVLGALIMSLMHSTSEVQASSSPHPDIIFDKEKIIGCLYLIAAVLALSSNVVLQASTLGDFPAPMSLTAITCFIGVIITLVVQLLQDHEIETVWPLVSMRDMIGYSLLGGMISGVSLSFNGWALKKKGPVLVSMFNPVGTVVSVVLSVFSVGDTFNLGSIAGMMIMFTGLYLVLWAKGKENIPLVGLLESDFDAEKPLLS